MKNSIRLFAFAIAGMLGISMSASAETFTRTISRDYNASDFQKLSVSVNTGSIDATGVDDSVIKIEIDLKAKTGSAGKADELFDKTDVLFNEEGEELSVVVKRPPRASFFSLIRGGRNLVRAEARVLLPRNYDVRLDTGSGHIKIVDVEGQITLDTGSGHINGSQLTGVISADTGSGSIKLDQVEGNVKADTGSGNIVLTELTGEFVADTGSGSVDASGIIHGFKADTGSGSVKIHSLSEISGRSVADTGSGSIQLHLPQPTGFSLNADTGSGGIDCGFSLQNTVQKKNFLKGDANGGGPLIVLDTGSGGISVQPIP